MWFWTCGRHDGFFALNVTGAAKPHRNTGSHPRRKMKKSESGNPHQREANNFTKYHPSLPVGKFAV
jgi:hypothetical protein